MRNPKLIPFFIVGALGIVGGVWFFNKGSIPEINVGSVVFAVPQKPAPKTETQDLDNDGLQDWEEALWKTDPYNPDTDGDGTSDEEEVRGGQDPLVAGSNDPPRDAHAQNDATKPLELPEPETLTDRFGRDFASIYLYGKNSGLDTQTMSDLISNSVALGFEKERKITNDSFVLPVTAILPSSPESLKTYGDALARIFVQEFANKNLTKNEMVLLLELLQGSPDALDKTRFEEFNRYSAAYASAAKELRPLSVPSSYASTHTSLINSFLRLSTITGALAEFPDDIARGVSVVADYRNESERAEKVFSALDRLPAFTL